MHKPSVFLAVDVGGSKTLIAVFSHGGQILSEQKIKTSPRYDKFIRDISSIIDGLKEEYQIITCCCAVPGKVDREHGIGKDFGNLKWHNSPIKHDLKKLINNAPVLVENDANLAGIYEASLKHKKYKKIMYVTISTGIGVGITIDGKLSSELLDAEPGQMMINHDGKLVKWENVASGRALLERFGKKASEQDDPAVWRTFARDIALGLEPVLSVVQPDAVIIGGSVGTYCEKYKDYLISELKHLENDMVEIPPVLKAEKPEEAVIYGCYEYIKQNT